MKRRTLLKAGLQLGLAGSTIPGVAGAAYPKKAFLADAIPDAMREVFGTADIGESDNIKIEVPPVATDANLVPVRIRSGFDNTESISIIVPGNRLPLTAHFKLFEKQNFVSTRVRMASTGDLLVVVKADGVLHTNRRVVRVGGHMCNA